MINEVGRVQKEAYVAYLKVLSRHSPEGTEENHEHSNDWCLGRYSNQAIPEYKSEPLLLEPSIAFSMGWCLGTMTTLLSP
jgi:hypothetical protein